MKHTSNHFPPQDGSREWVVARVMELHRAGLTFAEVRSAIASRLGIDAGNAKFFCNLVAGYDAVARAEDEASGEPVLKSKQKPSLRVVK